jgi:hypothetical protein
MDTRIFFFFYVYFCYRENTPLPSLITTHRGSHHFSVGVAQGSDNVFGFDL